MGKDAVHFGAASQVFDIGAKQKDLCSGHSSFGSTPECRQRSIRLTSA
jgi:hypothetical protein